MFSSFIGLLFLSKSQVKFLIFYKTFPNKSSPYLLQDTKVVSQDENIILLCTVLQLIIVSLVLFWFPSYKGNLECNHHVLYVGSIHVCVCVCAHIRISIVIYLLY